MNHSKKPLFIFSLLPIQASSVASEVDGITLGLLILSGLILALVFGMMFVFCALYRKGSPRSRESVKNINPKKERKRLLLEWGWTFATFFGFLAFFFWGALIYFNMHAPPADATEISVVGKQWMWKFQHPNGKRELDELHIPVGESILLTMTSQDVIHSFFVPSFRIKQDVLPGRYTRTWFKASRPGEYHLFCTEYCGTQHAAMKGKIIVMEKSDYQRWLQTSISSSNVRGTPSSMASRGRQLFTQMGCISCHGVNAGVRAPSLYGIFGKRVGLSDGSSVIADENYIREAILNPRAKIVQGYEPIMPTFAGLLSEEDVLDLIAYIKSLSSTPQAAGPQGPKTISEVPAPPPLKTGDLK